MNIFSQSVKLLDIILKEGFLTTSNKFAQTFLLDAIIAQICL